MWLVGGVEEVNKKYRLFDFRFAHSYAWFALNNNSVPPQRGRLGGVRINYHPGQNEGSL